MARYVPEISDDPKVDEAVKGASLAGHPNGVFNEDLFAKAVFRLQLAAKNAEKKTNETANAQFASLGEHSTPTPAPAAQL